MPSVSFPRKESYRMEDLVEMIRLLRSPQGCPWDKVQTHASLRSCMVEEAYEVVDAIDRQDADMLREELGDVLMQVVFHAGIEQDAGSFDFDDVCDGICKKMIYRHPHVFAQTQGINSSGQVLQQWEALKEQEKSLHTVAQDMQAIPAALPALVYAQKQHKRAVRHGFDTAPETHEVAQQAEALLCAEGDTPRHREECFGQLLHSLCGLADAWDINAEQALKDASALYLQKMIDREQH